MKLEERVNQVKKVCKVYSDSVARIIDAEKLEPGPEPGRLYHPVVVRKRLAWALDSLKANGYDVTELKKDLAVWDAQLEGFKSAHEEEYLRLSCNALRVLINRYDPMNTRGRLFEIELEINKRTDIEILFNELMACHALKDQYFGECLEIRDLYFDRVKARDDQLRIEVEYSLLCGTYSPDEVDSAPDGYWWLHLEESLRILSDDRVIPEYEEKEPEELVRIAKKLLARNLGPEIDRRAREMLELASEAKKNGTKVKIYY